MWRRVHLSGNRSWPTGEVRQAALGLALRGREGDETGPRWSSMSGYLADSAPGHAADYKEFCRLQIHL